MSSMESQSEDGSQTPPESVSGRRTERSGGERTKAPLVSKQKRIACTICRKRKLRCDGSRPSCGTCSRLRHDCLYDEVRRKSGPKRGYVKEMEARLSQLETQLKMKDRAAQARHRMPFSSLSHAPGDMDQEMMASFAGVVVGSNLTSPQGVPNVTVTTSAVDSSENTFPWELTSLGVEESLPPSDFIEDMYTIYFDKVAPSFPIIHKYRFLAAMNLAHHMRPPICLRYAIWALACSITDKYSSYADLFYQKARKYAEIDEMRGHGESFMTVGHAQCWILVTTYEFKMLFFPRAWMSAGRAARLAIMLGLHRQDGSGLEVKQVIPPPRDWTDREERRRTFWAAYCNDRYASVGTGWPMTFDEHDIMTNLPASTQAYEKNIEERACSLAEALKPDGTKNISSFGGVVLMACLFGENLRHLHRSTEDGQPEDPSGDFWKRHEKLDKTVAAMKDGLPDHLKLPQGSNDANVVFLNMNILAAIICLHQAAILQAEKHRLSARLISISTDKCYDAAEQIVALTRRITQVDLATMNPFISFCLYVAARIYTHAYKKRPKDEALRSGLDFLMLTMQAHRKKNPITESFLVQITFELEQAGLDQYFCQEDPNLSRPSHDLLREGEKCPPVFQAHSKTQPSFHELHSRESTSPIASNISYAASHSSGSRTQSPQLQYQSSFAVPTRERSSSLRPSQQQQHRSASIVPSQGWENSPNYMPAGNHQSIFASGTYEAMDTELSSENPSEHVVLTPTHSHRTSSHPSYSPQPQLHEENPMDRASAIGQLPASRPPVRAQAQPQQPPPPQHHHHQNQQQTHPYYGSLVHYPDFGAGAGVGFSTQGPSAESAFTMASEWDMQQDIPNTHEWGNVLDGIGWEDPSAMSISQTMGGWRPMPTTVGPNQ